MEYLVSVSSEQKILSMYRIGMESIFFSYLTKYPLYFAKLHIGQVAPGTPITYFIVVRRQLMQKLFDSGLFPGAVHIRDLIVRQAAVVLVDLWTQRMQNFITFTAHTNHGCKNNFDQDEVMVLREAGKQSCKRQNAP